MIIKVFTGVERTLDCSKECIAIEPSGRRVVHIRLSGEFDISQKAQLTELLHPAGNADEAVLEMSGVTYMDSTALGCLIHLKNEMLKHGVGTVRLVGLNASVLRVVTITRLDQIFELS